MSRSSHSPFPLTAIAAEIERTRNRRDLLTDVHLRRAYTVSVVAVPGRSNLPARLRTTSCGPPVEIVKIEDDGTVTIKMTAAEAK